MLSNQLSLLILLTGPSGESEAAQCDLFHNGLLCSLDPISNIVGAVFDLESELECQAECVSNNNCNNFMFATFSNVKPSNCFLLNVCNTNTTSCKETPDCSFSVAGPKTPSIPDACCQEFRGVTCEAESELSHFYDVAEAPECQSLCRDTSDCSYWSLYGEICFLYSACNHPRSCSSLCTSGPIFPDVSACEGTESFETLLIGGITELEGVTSSLELITQNRTCTPQMDQTPRPKLFAGAAVLGSKIFYCGGSQDESLVNSCHSFDLNKEGGGWQEEPSMVEARGLFGLSVVAGSLIASGGFDINEDPLSSVEVFKAGDGWKHDPTLDMSDTKYGHCTVVIGQAWDEKGRVDCPLWFSSFVKIQFGFSA